jgi:hypothetical protein
MKTLQIERMRAAIGAVKVGFNRRTWQPPATAGIGAGPIFKRVRRGAWKLRARRVTR